MTGTDIWQRGAHQVTISEAVDEFSRVYWAQPRKHTKLQADGTFQMVSGWATYRCRHVDGDFPLWVIEKRGE